MSKAKSLLAGCVVLLALPILAFGQKASKVPTISSLSPNTKTTGAGSFSLTVTGANFTSGSTVQWNGTGLTTTYISSTQLQGAVDGTRIATAGTASVKAYTSGRYGGTSNTLSFTITAPATTTTTTTTPPPPSPDPLSITTTSVPSATAGTAFNASLAGTGGTPAYTWSLPSGGGPLPPGLILATTGTLTGTPSTAGTYSFTVQAKDAASSAQTAQKVFSMSVAAPPTPPPTTTTTTSTTGVLFKNGFEPDDTPWNGGMVYEGSGGSGGTEPWGAYTEVTSNAPTPRTGSTGGHIHYVIPATAGVAHHDENRYFMQLFDANTGYPNGLDHVFVRGYFKAHLNPGAAENNYVQRKLFYLKDASTGGFNLNVVLTSDGHYFRIQNGVTGSFGSNPCAATGPISYSYGWPAPRYMGPPVWKWDTWYAVELEVQMNTPGVSDGVLSFWVDGTQYLHATGLNLRGTCSNAWKRIEVGVQTDRQNFDAVDEERYWDDVVMSTQYIGP